MIQMMMRVLRVVLLNNLSGNTIIWSVIYENQINKHIFSFLICV